MSENPVFSIAGAMPGGAEMNWQTAYPNPDAHLVHRFLHPSTGHGPSFSMAGAMTGAPTVTHWQTAFPTGESIYVDALRRAEARDALEAAEASLGGKVLALPSGVADRHVVHPQHHRRPSAA